MKRLHTLAAGLVIATLIIAAAAWSHVSAHGSSHNNIVGAWFVKAPDAPFQYHMFTFHADGTMQQSNPDAGNPNTSDSDGHGIWVKSGKQIKGKFVEATADRTTNSFVSRGEISFQIDVDGNSLTGTASANFYDEDNNLTRGPLPTALEGTRVTLP
jgi:hypothetical protein